MEKFKTNAKAMESRWRYDGIRERFVVSKNVCHQAVYDADLHARIGEHLRGRAGPASREPSGARIYILIRSFDSRNYGRANIIFTRHHA